MKELILIIDYG